MAGVSGGTRNGCAAVTRGRDLAGVCAQERVVRVRGAGVNGSGLPDEALDLLLRRLGRSRRDIARYVVAAPSGNGQPAGGERVAHHFAHACTAYLSSPFQSAAIVVCDHEWPYISVWTGSGQEITPVEWPWSGPGFPEAYSRIASAFGFDSNAGGQHLEALARLRPDARDPVLEALIGLGDAGVTIDPSLERVIEERLAGEREPGGRRRAETAAALQARIQDLFVELLGRVGRSLPADRLCLGGSFDCAIVVDDYRVLNEDGLRFEDEFVRHKMLDAIGDLFMCGHNIIGAFTAYKSGHALNNKLLQAVLAKQEAWEYVTFQDDAELPLAFKAPSTVLA